MKQTIIQHSTIQRSSPFTADDIHVAQILLDITTMIRSLESGSGFKWGTKKRRSRLDAPYHKTHVATPPHPKSAAAAASSPVTPLAFSNHLFNKTSREEYMQMIEGLSQRRDLLRGENDNVTIYYNKLIACNSQLKAMKQEVLNSCPRKEEPKLERSIDGNLAKELIPKFHQISVKNETHPQPYVEDQRVEIFRSSFRFGPNTAQFHSPYNGLRSINNVGPGIPDLNVSAEEILGVDPNQPLDRNRVLADRRTRFAEARRRRMDIIRVKSMSTACVFKFPRTRK